MRTKIDWVKISDLACRIAVVAHHGQTRRDNVTPYIGHPTKVADNIFKMGVQFKWSTATTYRRACLAMLHDVLEDTKVTAEDLILEGIPPALIWRLKLLTKAPDQDYDDHLEELKQHEDTRWVKIADNLANLSDLPTVKQMIKYGKSLTYLNS